MGYFFQMCHRVRERKRKTEETNVQPEQSKSEKSGRRVVLP